ncbi:MAG: hypothetical protein LQ343_003205 [Gyalolechia ehrenbergii]|nr:MAG: hypothetical protein LQ343_003205 [Gyalolechia ehrenbergii]
MACDYFTHIGDLLSLVLLQCQADDEKQLNALPTVERQLALIVERSWIHGFGGRLLFPRAEKGRCFRIHGLTNKWEKQLLATSKTRPVLNPYSQTSQITNQIENFAQNTVVDAFNLNVSRRFKSVEPSWSKISHLYSMDEPNQSRRR